MNTSKTKKSPSKHRIFSSSDAQLYSPHGSLVGMSIQIQFHLITQVEHIYPSHRLRCWKQKRLFYFTAPKYFQPDGSFLPDDRYEYQMSAPFLSSTNLDIYSLDSPCHVLWIKSFYLFILRTFVEQTSERMHLRSLQTQPPHVYLSYISS